MRRPVAVTSGRWFKSGLYASRVPRQRVRSGVRETLLGTMLTPLGALVAGVLTKDGRLRDRGT